MNLQSLLLLIISFMLVIISAWTLNIFIRLEKASSNYNSDEMFDTACHVSKKYSKYGKIMATIFFVISILIMIISSSVIYSNLHH